MISDRIHYVGVNDTEKTLFEGLWPLPYGVSYNSYIIKDEKIALIDTVESGNEEEYLGKIHEVIGDRQIDYLVINHMEPDHSSLISFKHDYLRRICKHAPYTNRDYVCCSRRCG